MKWLVKASTCPRRVGNFLHQRTKRKPVGRSSRAADLDQNKENLLNRAAQQQSGLPVEGSRESEQESSPAKSSPNSITQQSCALGKFFNLSVLICKVKEIIASTYQDCLWN